MSFSAFILLRSLAALKCSLQFREWGRKLRLLFCQIRILRGLRLLLLPGTVRRLLKPRGVGPKLAQRIVLELKDKIAKETSSKELAEGFRIPEAPSGDNVSEAMSALMVLGYTQAEAASAVSKIDSSLDSGEIIKRALKIIGSQMK